MRREYRVDVVADNPAGGLRVITRKQEAVNATDAVYIVVGALAIDEGVSVAPTSPAGGAWRDDADPGRLRAELARVTLERDAALALVRRAEHTIREAAATAVST